MSRELGARWRFGRGKRSRPKSIPWAACAVRRPALSALTASLHHHSRASYRALVPADSYHYRTLHLPVSIIFYIFYAPSFMRL